MKTMIDLMREQRYDDKYISNATGTTQAITAADFNRNGKNGINFVYDGAGLTTVTLPTAVVGYALCFEVRGAGGVKVTPYSTELITGVSGVMTNAPIYSTTKGSRLMISCEVAGEWTVIYMTGRWSNDLAVSNSGATSVALTAADCDGKNYILTGAGLTTYTLPAAVAGLKVGFKVRGSGGVKICPATGEYLAGICTTAGAAFSGAYGTANQYIQNTTPGSMIILECLTTGYWAAVGGVDVWVLAT